MRLPARTQAVVLQLREERCHIIQPPSPLRTHLGDERNGLFHTLLVFLVLRQGFNQFIAQRELVAQTQFDIDALNAIRVFRHTRQRNHHIFVHLEGVGVA